MTIGPIRIFSIHRHLILTANGITNKLLTQPARSLKAEKIPGSPVIAESVVKPVAWFKFDEAAGDTTYESLSKSDIGS